MKLFETLQGLCEPIEELLRCPFHPSDGLLTMESEEIFSFDQGLFINSVARCSKCDAFFPVINNIPNLVVPNNSMDNYFEVETQQWDEQALEYERLRLNDQRYMAGVNAAVEALDVQSGHFILDVGCGTGLTVRRYCQSDVRIVALDLSMRSLSFMLDRTEGFPILSVRGNVTALPFGDGMFDRIMCANTLQQLPDSVHRKKCVAELARVLRPGGRVVITTHNWSPSRQRAGWQKEGPAGSHSGPLQYVYRHEVEEFRGLLETALSVRRVTGAAFPLPYRFKLAPTSHFLERILRRIPYCARFGDMLVGVCEKPT